MLINSRSKNQILDLSACHQGIYMIRVIGYNGEISIGKVSKNNTY